MTEKTVAEDHIPAQTSVTKLLRRRPMALVKVLGPGLIAGASDNDPTTVATLAIIGASTVYGLSWLVILVIPMLVIVQVVSARVGVVARAGLEDCVRSRYGPVLATVTLLFVLAVNIITLAADLEGGSAALALLTGKPYQWFIIPFAVAVAALLIWGSYAAMQKVLRYVLLIFLAYIVTAFLAHPNWGEVLRATVIPHFSFSPEYVSGALALLGTTLTSYAYVWETIEVSEEHPRLSRLGLVQVDAASGVIAAGIIFWFIVIGTGATLGVHHQQVQTAQDAAQALAPIAGPLASVFFGVGLLASAIIAVPVLAGTSAYVMAEMFHWRASLDASFARARAFYLTLIFCLGVGVVITYLGVSPIHLLFFASIAGGLATPFTLIVLMAIARDRTVMGTARLGRGMTIAGWLVVAVVTIAGGIFLVQTVMGGS